MKQCLANTQRGSGLLELMIGLFVLGIGLLGMSSMQNNALRQNNNAYLYSQATFLASDIIERMRANRDQVASYVTDLEDLTVASITNCNTSNCLSPGHMARWDLSLWKADVAALLPQGKAAVAVNGRNVTVTIEFDDSNGELDATGLTTSTTI